MNKCANCGHACGGLKCQKCGNPTQALIDFLTGYQSLERAKGDERRIVEERLEKLWRSLNDSQRQELERIMADSPFNKAQRTHKETDAHKDVAKEKADKAVKEVHK